MQISAIGDDPQAPMMGLGITIFQANTVIEVEWQFLERFTAVLFSPFVDNVSHCVFTESIRKIPKGEIWTNRSNFFLDFLR